MDDRFEIVFPEDFTCSGCQEPKMPYTMIAPCGHSFCEECAEQSSQCPECHGTVACRNTVVQMSEMVEKAGVYNCRECDWSGPMAAAQKHRCDVLYLRFRPLMPDLDPDTFEAALDPFRQRSLEQVDDEAVLEVLLRCFEEQQDQQAQLSQVRRTATAAATTAAPASLQATPAPTPAASGKDIMTAPRDEIHSLTPTATTTPITAGAKSRTIIFWDYDNINQSKCGRGVSTTAFLVGIVKALKQRKIMPNQSWDGHAYFVNGVAYPDNVVEACSKLQVQRYLCSRKREAADRELQKKLRDVAKDRIQSENDSRIVLISDDGDFIETVKEVWDEYQCPVHVIHHAQGDHLFHLQAHAASTIDIKEIFPEFGGLSHNQNNNPQQQAQNSTSSTKERGSRGGGSEGPSTVVPKTVLIEGKAVAVDQLVASRQLQFLLSHPTIVGKWCREAPTTTNNNSSGGGGGGKRKQHDPMKCKFLHKKPKTTQVTSVVVEGKEVLLAGLVPNLGTQYLLANPTRQGSYCTRAETKHNVESCKYIHRVPPRSRVGVDGGVRAQGKKQQSQEQLQRGRGGRESRGGRDEESSGREADHPNPPTRGATAPPGTGTCATHGKQRRGNELLMVARNTYVCVPEAPCRGVGPGVLRPEPLQSAGSSQSAFLHVQGEKEHPAQQRQQQKHAEPPHPQGQVEFRDRVVRWYQHYSPEQVVEICSNLDVAHNSSEEFLFLHWKKYGPPELLTTGRPPKSFRKRVARYWERYGPAAVMKMDQLVTACGESATQMVFEILKTQLGPEPPRAVGGGKSSSAAAPGVYSTAPPTAGGGAGKSQPVAQVKSSHIPDDDILQAASARELLSLLAQHDVSCLGVTEKTDLVKLAQKKRSEIPDDEILKGMPVRQLVKLLNFYKVSTVGYSEKGELVELLQRERFPIPDDYGLGAMSVRELLKLLAGRQVSIAGYTEKAELVELAQAVRISTYME